MSSDTTLAEAARIMLDERIGSVLVLDAEGRLVGIVSDSDFGSSEGRVPFSTFRAPKLLDRWIGESGVEEVYEEARDRVISEIMTSPVHSVQPDASIREVLDAMLRHGIKHLPVLEGETPVGMIARHDLLKVIHRELCT